MDTVVWNIDNIDCIGGHKTTVIGSPKIINTDKGKAVLFDGKKDGLFLNVHPLEGLKAFTFDVVFRPDPDGLAEQRFFHMQEDAGENRVLMETRLTPKSTWYLDTYIESGENNQTLIDPNQTHPLGQWYSGVLIYDGSKMSHYVNGVKELEVEKTFVPQGPGHTSIGVRANKVYWFKGAMRKVRFTPRALSPEEFPAP